MMIRTMLRLRPPLLDESAPTAAPTIPIGMTSQFIQPSSGMNATRPSTKVTLDKDGDGFKITKSALTLNAKVNGISKEEFEAIAADAKANCPVSKVLNAEIMLEHTLAA